jgi:hypothetical protein
MLAKVKFLTGVKIIKDEGHISGKEEQVRVWKS